ncbi:MAG TPA: NACHT domain-containing protein [Thermoanaerobaculia bacterium]
MPKGWKGERPSAILTLDMIDPIRPDGPLHDRLEQEVVAPLFAKLPLPEDDSVPEIVLRHRLRRAQSRVTDALVSRGSATVPIDLLREIEKLVRNWAAESFIDASKAIEDFEIRCAQEHDLVVARESGDAERILTALESELRRKTVEQFGSLELRGIQTSHRVWQKLDEAYVPLHLETLADERQLALLLLARERFPVSTILARYTRILIVGTPGSGKSTLVAYLASRTATGQLSEELGWREQPIPFVLTVRALEGHTLTDRSLAQHLKCDIELVTRALERQNAFLLVDGLDEAPEETRTKLIESLHRFGRRYPRLRIVTTSRPAGGPGEIESRLVGFKPFRLADLTGQEVDDFIDKWCLAAEQSISKDHTEARKEAYYAASDLKRRLAESYSVQRIAVNPLLVAILCVVHRFLGRTIPEHRVTLYEKCTDALLYEWDRAKFADGAAVGFLDARSKRRLLMGIARKVHNEHLAEVPEREVIEHFRNVLPDLGRPSTDAKRIVEEVRDRSGLLVEKRPGFFSFSHLTFQEYLCALDYVQTKSFTDLVNKYQDPWWQEVIVLAAGVPGTDSGLIPRKLLARRRISAVLLAAQCAETEIDMPREVREKVETSLRKFIPPNNFQSARLLQDLGIAAAPLLTKALTELADESTRTWTLYALDRIDYDPAIAAIAQCARDKRDSEISFHFPERKDNTQAKLTIGGFAAYILAGKASRSDTARNSFKRAAAELDQCDLEVLRDVFPPNSEVRTVINNALRVARRAKSAKRAQSTA